MTASMSSRTKSTAASLLSMDGIRRARAEARQVDVEAPVARNGCSKTGPTLASRLPMVDPEAVQEQDGVPVADLVDRDGPAADEPRRVGHAARCRATNRPIRRSASSSRSYDVA